MDDTTIIFACIICFLVGTGFGAWMIRYIINSFDKAFEKHFGDREDEP